MNRQNKLVTRGRFNALTRKMQLRNAQYQNNAKLADEVAKRLEPFIKDQIARQVDDTLAGYGLIDRD